MTLTGKVALITGGASGIGKSCVEEFLKNNAKGIVIADINADLGEKTTKDFNEKFGQERVTFVETNISDKDSFENAFQKAIKKYYNIDILVNSAAIFDEVNWEKLLNINIIGTTHGCVLATKKYFPKYKTGPVAYIVNIASIAAFVPLAFAPHYASSKHAIVGLTRSFGVNKTIAEQGVYVMALCPGATETPMLLNPAHEKIFYTELIEEGLAQFISQSVEAVSRSVMEMLNKPENGSLWVINEGVLSKVKFPSLEEMISNIS